MNYFLFFFQLYGEIGSDSLDGGDGDDICLGDIGYVVRRYSSFGDAEEIPLVTSKGTWSKSIILEEQGFIKSAHKISSKVDTTDLTAEMIMTESSFLIVANGFEPDGSKTPDTEDGSWLTDILIYDLQPADDDTIAGGNGDDILIGGRGSDTIR